MFVTGASGDVMLDRKSFDSIDGPEIRLRPASDAVRYQLIDVGDNKTTTIGSDVAETSRHTVQSTTLHPGPAPAKPPKLVVWASSSASPLLHAAGSVNISSRTTAVADHELSINMTTWKLKLQPEIALASKNDSVSVEQEMTTKSSYNEKQLMTNETLSSVLANDLRTKDNTVNTGSRKLSLPLTVSGENRLRGIPLNRTSDVDASTVAAIESRDQHADQSSSTTWSPEVNNTTGGWIENRTDVWNVEELGDSTRSTVNRVRYVHTLLTEDGGGRTRIWLRPSEVASISAVCAFCFFLFLVAALVFVVYRRRRTRSRSKMVCSNGWKSEAADEKLTVLRRVAAESETLSPDLLDQIIRAELARGRAKRYRARLRDGDDREQLERLAVELSDDWGTPPPSYRRLTPVGGGPPHRRPLWPGDSPARVHDIQPSIPELPPPIPERSFTRPAVVPLDFRQFRRPLPEIPPQVNHFRTYPITT